VWGIPDKDVDRKSIRNNNRGVSAVNARDGE